MTEFEDKNDSTVQPASRTMSSFNAVFAKLDSSPTEHDRLIHRISKLEESLNALQPLINSFEEHSARTEKRLNSLEDNDDERDHLKDEIFCLKQMVDMDSADCLSVQDECEKRYLTVQDEQ